MDITRPLPLLGGLTPAQFMRRHWGKKPLLVRGAIAGFRPLLDRRELFALAQREQVESRLVAQAGESWRLRRGPFTRRALPPLARPRWTLLVQGVDLHDARAHDLLARFRFVPQARLDDLMISYASDGGGVGPHFDSYDVFLLQAQGRRHWRVGRQDELALRPDVPLKILASFKPEHEYVLEPGDLLYLPPRYAHDGVAQGECQTYSIGFRSPAAGELARDLLQRLADGADEAAGERLYRDRAQRATGEPGAIPTALQDFARRAVASTLKDPLALQRALGEVLSEPKPSVWFESAPPRSIDGGILLDRRTRMMYDAAHVFVNGESFRAAGRDAVLMRRLADSGRLDGGDVVRASAAARSLLASWQKAGWVRCQEGAT
ncbi:MAG TPA: cupin domain-containing protein [Ramlibacter sp.]|nr:cupin domain-containing protein [Ramlibacter sp.]